MAFSPPVVVFFISNIFGVFLAIVWDCFRLIRKRVNKKARKLLIALDVMFFLFAIVATLIFFFIYTFSGFRIFVIVGEILGAILYYATIGPSVFKFLSLIDCFINDKLRIFKTIKNSYLAIFNFPGKLIARRKLNKKINEINSKTQIN